MALKKWQELTIISVGWVDFEKSSERTMETVEVGE